MVWGLKLLCAAVRVPGGVGFLMDISARYGTEKIRNLIRNIDWLLLTCDIPGSRGGGDKGLQKITEN